MTVHCSDADIAETFQRVFSAAAKADIVIKISDQHAQCFLDDSLLHEAELPIYMHDFKKTCVKKLGLMTEHHLIQYHGMALDCVSNHLLCNNEEIELTAKETALLRTLMQADEAVEKETLINTMWQQQFVDTGTFDTHLYRLRQKTAAYFEILCSNNLYKIMLK